MPCSPRTARAKLDSWIDLAKQADREDFRHAVRLGASMLTIHTGPAGELPPVFTRGADDRFIDKRTALQLIELYSSEGR